MSDVGEVLSPTTLRVTRLLNAPPEKSVVAFG